MPVTAIKDLPVSDLARTLLKAQRDFLPKRVGKGLLEHQNGDATIEQDDQERHPQQTQRQLQPERPFHHCAVSARMR